MHAARTGLFLALLGLLALGAGPAHAQLGLAAGGNFNKLTDIETEPKAAFDQATGFHVGLFYDLGVGPVSLRPGLYYVDVGAFEAQVACAPGTTICDPRTFDLNLIEAPLDVRFRVVTAPVVRPYVLAGPVFRFANTSDEALDAVLEAFSYTGNVGFGVEVGAPTGLRVHTELRYAFAGSSMFQDFTFLGAAFTPDEEPDLTSWMLRLGVSF